MSSSTVKNFTPPPVPGVCPCGGQRRSIIVYESVPNWWIYIAECYKCGRCFDHGHSW
jgi:hypothetical protein